MAGKTEWRRAERQVKELEQEIEAKKTEKAQNYIQYKAGELPKEGFFAKKADLQREILEKQQKIEELSLLLRDLQGTPGKLEADKFQAAEPFGGYTRIERLDRETIGRLVKAIWVYDGERVKVDLTFIPYITPTGSAMPVKTP